MKKTYFKRTAALVLIASALIFATLYYKSESPRQVSNKVPPRAGLLKDEDKEAAVQISTQTPVTATATATATDNPPDDSQLSQWLDLIDDSSVDEKQKYPICLKLSDLGDYPAQQWKRLRKTFLECRIIRNRFGMSKERTARWQEMRKLLNTEGWQAVIAAIESGKYPVNMSLQDAHPQHDLFYAFIGADIDDIEAYEALINLGLKPNTKFLGMIATHQKPHLYDFYLQHADIYAINDMQYNAVFSTARFGKGDLTGVKIMLDIGVPYEDKIGRDPLAEVLKRRGISVNAEEFLAVIDNYQIPISDQLLEAAKSEDVPPTLLSELQRRKGTR